MERDGQRRLRARIFLILGILGFAGTMGTLNHRTGIAAEGSIDAMRLDSQVRPRQKMAEYPIEYTVIDRYATGEEIVRGTTNSLNPSLPAAKTFLSNASHPMRENQTSLLGSGEIILLKNELKKYDKSGNPYQTTTGPATEVISYTYETGIVREDEIAETTINDGGPDLVSELATGEFDGNLLKDIVIVSIKSQKMRVQIVENWGGMGLVIIADTTDSGLFNCDFIPTVASGDIDGDNLDEFIIVGQTQSQPTIWIYDDLVNDTTREVLFYGDKIMLSTYEAPNSYLISNQDITRQVIDDTRAPENTQFTILYAHDFDFRGPVQYSDEIVLKDGEGKFWKVDNDTDTIVKEEIKEGNIKDEHKFVLISDRGEYNSIGVVYYRNYLSLRDYRRQFVASPSTPGAKLGFDTQYTQSRNWFKVISNDSIPLSFSKTPLQPVHTLINPEFQKIDILPRTGFDYHIATKSVAMGDVDGDSRDEIIVVGMDATGSVRAWVYDDMLNDFKKLNTFSWGDPIKNITPGVVVGDVDGDELDEIIFSFTTGTYGQVEIYDDAISASKFSNLIKIPSSSTELFGDITRITTGDIDKDERDEIIFVNGTCGFRVWDDSSTNFAFMSSWMSQMDYSWLYPTVTFDHIDYYIPVDLICEDVDQDGHDEMLLSSLESETLNLLDNSYTIVRGWEYNETGFSEFRVKGLELRGEKFIIAGGMVISGPHLEDGTISWTAAPITKLAIGDYNGNQFIVKYRDRGIYTAEEQLIAVMAAPPTLAGISQNYDASGTEYGQGKSVGQSVEAGVSVGAGVYASLEVEAAPFFGIQIAKFESETSLKVEFSATGAIATTYAFLDTYSGDYESDFVIFSSNVYDKFIYEVMECPDPSLVGHNFSVYIPNKVAIHKWDREFYNSQNSEYAQDIGLETFNYTIGNVLSYPTEEEMDKIAPDCLQSNWLEVGKGGGSNTVEIDFSIEKAIGIETGFEFEYKTGIGGGGVTAGIFFSIGGSLGMGWSWGEDTMFVGTVGDIKEDEDYINWHYAIALCVYVGHYIPKAIEADEQAGVPGLAKLATLHLDIFDRGYGYYILNYIVDTPTYWGEDAEQAIEFASDMEKVVDSLDVPGWTFCYVIIPLFSISLYQRYRKRRGEGK